MFCNGLDIKCVIIQLYHFTNIILHADSHVPQLRLHVICDDGIAQKVGSQ